MNCPLCGSGRSLILRSSNLIELKNNWLKSFGFDPFPSRYSPSKIDKKRCTSCQLEFFDPPLFGDAGFYAKLSKYPWYYEQNKWEFDVATEAVARLAPASLLEIGCGYGDFLEKIFPLGIDAEGVDINQDAVQTCKSKGLKVDAIPVFDITKTYDMVVLFEVLEHMENAKELFEFLTTKLIKRGGYLIIAVPNPDGYLKELDINLLDMPPHHNSSWSLKCFEKLTTLHGLTLLEYNKEPLRLVHYYGYMHHLANSVAKLSFQSWEVRIFYKFQSFIIRLFAPFTYLRDRERIDGQTHLVVLRNDR